ASNQYRRYHLQPNRGANDPTLKALASKDPHAVLSYADIPLVEAPAEGDVDEGIQGNDAANDNTNKMLKKF
ncbi:hypothetical protein E4U34_007377, partial [Claviceps purpurea]